MVDFIKFKGNDDGDDSGKSKPRAKLGFSFIKLIWIFAAFMIISSIISSISFSLSPKIAVIKINGVIQTGNGDSIIGGESINSRIVADDLYTIKEDSTVKAVILDINSPGGSPVASEEITKAIEALKEDNITVISVISDIGASGAFWIASSTDKIYASSMSTVGSIGVTSAGLSFENFIKDYNITYRKQTAGEYKDMGSIFREPTEIEKEKIQNILDEVHSNFITHVANGRDLSYEFVEQYATGEIFLGSLAKEIGFIDEIGYYQDVVDEMKEEHGENVLFVEYGPLPTLMESLGVKSNGLGLFSSKSQILLQ